MKRLVLVPLVLLMLFFAANAQKRMQQQIYYYYKDQKVYYPVSNDRLVVGIRKGTSFANIRESVATLLGVSFDSVKESLANNQFIIKLGHNNQGDISPLIAKLKQLSYVLFARPVYKSGSGNYCSYGTDFIVNLKPSTSFATLQNLIEKNGCSLVRKYPFQDDMYILAAGKSSGYDGLAMANLFYETGLFDYAEPDKMVYDALHTDPNDPKYLLQWAHKNTGSAAQYNGTPGADMKVQQAWTISMGQPYIKIGVIDEGVDLTHPDLAANLLQGFDGGTLTSNPGDGAPRSSARAHGTNCAGIIAAIANNNIGVAGIAPNCKIIPAVIFDDNGYLGDAAVAGSFDYVRLQGADVISNSWGGGSVSSTIDDAINRAVTFGRHGKGCMVLFSSGNNNAGVSYPANNNQTIAVGGVNMCGQRKNPTSCDGETWWGANYGPNLDVVAPCVKIASTDIQGTGGYNTSAGTTGDYYDIFNGTSSACPNAAGVAALIYSVDSNLTVAQATQILELSCDKLPLYTYGTNAAQPNGTWEDSTGHGRVNAYAALQLATTGNFCSVGIQSSGTTICNGNITLSIINPDGSATYQWRRNGAAVGSGTSYSTNVPGTYSAVITKGSCTAISADITLTAAFGVTIRAVPDSVCSGGTSSLAAILSSNTTSYCQPTYAQGTGFGDSITLVKITGTTLNNPSGGATSSPFYTLYPQVGATTATLSAGTTYSMTVKGGSYQTMLVRGWIDYNQNGVFESTETIGISGNVGSLTTGSFSFTVPAGAINGVTRLRMRSSDTSPGATDAQSCSETNSPYGETEDYIITISSSVPPYTYAWTESPAGSTLASTTGATVTANNITATKTYTVTVTNANGCVVAISKKVVLKTVSFSSSFVKTNVACYGNTNGSATVTVTGGTPPYQYKNGPSGIYQSSTTFSGLKAGNYRIYFQDVQGCTGFTAVIAITQPSAALFVSGTHNNVSCNGAKDGIIFANASGGTPPYRYKNNAGAYQTTGTFSGLAPGNYRIYVIDSNGCTAFTSVFAVTQPAVLASTFTKTDATCATTANGTMTVSLTGGTPIYTYSSSSSGPYQNSPTFTGLLPGSYRIFYQDVHGCHGFTGIIAIGPAALVVTGTKTNPTCNGASDGTITGSVTGGRPPYQYAKASGGPYQTSSTIRGLKAGSYRVYVRDSSGCTAFSPVLTLTNPTNTCGGDVFSKILTPVKDRELEVVLSPNPATEQFTLLVHGKSNVPVTIRVVDVNGRSLQQMKGAAEQTFRFGSSLSTGVYMIEVRQGDEVKTVKGVKMK